MQNKMLQIIEAVKDKKIFAERYFRDPQNIHAPLRLRPGQRVLFDIIEGFKTEKHRIVVMIWPRGSGKTEGISIWSAVEMILNSNAHLGFFAEQFTQPKHILRRLKWYIRNSPFKFMKGTIWSKEEMNLINDAYAMAHKGEREEETRGAQHTIIFVDEASLVAEDKLKGAMIPTTFARSGGRIVLLSTPREATGVFHEFYEKGQMDKYKDFIKIVDVSHLEHPTLKGDVKDLWVDLLGGEDSVIVRREIYAEFADIGDAVFPSADIKRALSPSEEYGIHYNNLANIKLKKEKKQQSINKYSVSVDLGEMADRTVIMIGHREKDEIFVDYLESHIKRKYPWIKRRLAHIIKYCNARKVIPDANSMGQPFIEECVDFFKKNDIITRIHSNKNNRKGFVFEMNSKREIIENLKIFLANNQIRLPNFRSTTALGNREEYEASELVRELRNYKYEFTAQGNIKFGRKHIHDDRVIALALLVEGLKRKEFEYIKPILV